MYFFNHIFAHDVHIIIYFELFSNGSIYLENN